MKFLWLENCTPHQKQFCLFKSVFLTIWYYHITLVTEIQKKRELIGRVQGLSWTQLRVIYTSKPSKTQTHLSKWLSTQHLCHPSVGKVQKSTKGIRNIHSLVTSYNTQVTKYTTISRVGITAKVVHIPNVHFHSCATRFGREVMSKHWFWYWWLTLKLWALSYLKSPNSFDFSCSVTKIAAVKKT